MKITPFIWLLPLYVIVNTSIAQSIQMQWMRTCGSSNVDQFSKITINSNEDVIGYGSYRDNIKFTATDSLLALQINNTNYFLSSYDRLGAFKFAHRILEIQNGSSIEINGIICNKIGEIILVGSFAGTADFAPGNSVLNITSEFGGAPQSFILVLNSNGTYNRHILFDGADILIKELVCDSRDHVYMVGQMGDDIDIDPGTGVVTLDGSPKDWSGFYLHLDQNLEYQYGFSLTGVPNSATNIDVSKTGVIVIGGSANGDGKIDFNPEIPKEEINFNITQGGNRYLLKLNKNEHYVWAKSFITGIYSFASLKILPNESISLFGNFEGKLVFNAGNDSIQSNLGNKDLFLLSVDSSGGFEYVKSFGSYTTDFAYQHVIDNNGNQFLCGSFFYGCDFDPDNTSKFVYAVGNRDAFISKFNFKGDFISVLTWGGFQFDQAYSISNLNENIYVAGSFGDSCKINLNTTNQFVKGRGGQDGFIAKISNNNLLINQSNQSKELKVFPNPATLSFTLESIQPLGKVVIINLNGQVVYETNTAENLVTINLEECGLYFIQITNKESTYSKKVIINH